jgi:hypothetical protein
MVVYPSKNLVVVRMICWTSYVKGEGNKEGTSLNSFDDFFTLTRNL